MAAPTSQPAPKKKASKIPERTDSPAPSTASGAAEKATDLQDDAFESPYIKELQKNIRNINKKITNASKTDTQLKEHPGKSLEELVEAKIINADQRAQILKKPALQAQLTQAEEQLTQYRKLHEQYQAKFAADKAEWEKSVEKSVEKAKEDALRDAKQGSDNTTHENLLILSQFLRLAAYRREEAQEPESDESQAIEGVLLAIYSGDDSAVSSMRKLVEGSDEQILSVPGEQLQTTYSKVRSLARAYTAPFSTEGVQAAEAAPSHEIGTDPTVAHASGTEIAAGDVAAVNGAVAEPATNGLSNAHVSDEAANRVGESHWVTGNDLSISQEWVDVTVPRDPTETETGLAATPAAPANTQSWADDAAEAVQEAAPAVPAATAPPSDPNDGFHQVQRNHKRNEREGGNYRGRGRGEWRGRGGHRGDGRGRGRGNRGSGVPSRGPRRSEE